MEIKSKYEPSQIEDKWYEYWDKHKLFSSKPDNREPYTIVIPPPNVTGVLHMGHVLNETIQDILVRRARMNGKNALWVPGTDHASIATEAKVVAKLAEQGIKKSDLTREEFLKHAWAWTEEHGGIILKQLRKLGASCDWDRTAFTMDEVRSKSVIHVFVDLYRKGLIYRGVRMVNWDPKAQTALSDEEVVYHDEHSKLYYLRYYVVDPQPGEKMYAVVATTRPETIMGDTAMCINPNDPKNSWLKGKHVIVPLVGREIPVIEDDYVDIEFGTGCLKVTPCHDPNDYMLGEKYNLQKINIFNPDGTISEEAGMYVGMDRFELRSKIADDLEKAGLLEKVEDYNNKVGYSERTNVPIEPRLSMQWFLKMKHFAEMALPPVMNDEIKFYPAKYKNTYKHWLENIKDWCISRQLWWGHRIPAWYLPDRSFVVAETKEEAYELALRQSQNKDLKIEDLKQDEEALDTWFSSWLWPISLFDGINNPGNPEISYYYPTSDLVTGPDIIFFWVARMIMAGYEYTGKEPFKNVYFTGIVRDKLGRKMSKSLGNSPDPLLLIQKYGADSVRMGMMLSAPAGNDILFDESLCEQGRNFCNKIWNSFRFIKSLEVSESIEQDAVSGLAVKWMNSEIVQSQNTLDDLFSKFRISEALMEVYRLFKDIFSSWYLEIIKPGYGNPIDARTYDASIDIMERLMKLLHPFMPFITEEIWHDLRPRKDGESIMTTLYTKADLSDDDAKLISEMADIMNIVSGVRAIRARKNIPIKNALRLNVKGTLPGKKYIPLIQKLAGVSSVEEKYENDGLSASFIVGTTEYSIVLGDMLDKKQEKAKAIAELEHLERFLQSINKKLGNENFVAHAPQKVIDLERKKQQDTQIKIATLKETLKGLEE
jgi:valyl-tRNA synthetase